MNKSPRIIYMGTPDFAVAPLRSLVEGGYNVVAVVTMPDKPIGRGMKMQSSPVKQYAVEAGLPVLQPEKLKDEAFIEALRSYNADLQIVVAFRMLPEIVWAMPPMGTFNLHASLLPQYRGAAPIHWAVINGEKETGVTTFLLKHEIDTGNILLQERIEIAPDETTGSVHDRLMQLGATLVPKTVDLLVSGDYQAIPQEQLTTSELNPAPKLFKENTQIDWNRPSKKIYNFIRGLSPYPAAWTTLEVNSANGKSEQLAVKIFEVALREGKAPAGTVVTDGKHSLKVATSDGFVEIRRLQVPGKRQMSADEYLRGFQQTPSFTIVL